MQKRKDGGETRVRTERGHREQRTSGEQRGRTTGGRPGAETGHGSVQKMRMGLGDAQKPELRSPLSLLSPKL